jgi:intraflagellar transport protein 81
MKFKRDQLNKRLNEQESLGKTLKDKQKSLKDFSIDGTKQTKLWRDLLRQMEMKRKISLVY